jgi:hypothetical protein
MKLRGFCKRTVCITYGDVRIVYRMAMEMGGIPLVGELSIEPRWSVRMKCNATSVNVKNVEWEIWEGHKV